MIRTEAIIWDWNGTLLDDVDICVQSMNSILAPRGMPLLDRQRYSRVFTFPVIDYYRKLGFDFEKDPFEKVGMDFIVVFRKKIFDACLFPEVPNVLAKFAEAGIRQFIVSAMEQGLLEALVRNCGIENHFEKISGIDDHYAAGKIAQAKRLFDAAGLDPLKTLMIGDTVHDHEVASVLGCRSVLVASGHQEEARLKETGSRVIRSVGLLLEI